MPTLDIELDDARTQAPRARSEKPKHPRRDELWTVPMLYESLSKVGSSLRCSEWGAVGFHADRCATIWANLSDVTKDGLHADFWNPPSGLGEWSACAWTAYAVWWCLWQDGQAKPPDLVLAPVCDPKDRENMGSDWMIRWTRGEWSDGDERWREWQRVRFNHFVEDAAASHSGTTEAVDGTA